MKELVIVDIDNTLIKGQSQKVLLRYLYNKKMVGVFYFSRIYLWFVLYKLGLVKNPRIVLEYAIRFLRGKRVLGIQKLIKEFAVHELPPLFFRGMLEIIEGHKRAGRKIVLVSNTIDALVKEIASMIGVDDFIALKLEIKDNVYTGKVSGSLVYGENKYNVIKSTNQTPYLYKHYLLFPTLMQ